MSSVLDELRDLLPDGALVTDPDVLRLTKAVQAALDPDGILNPGKWV